MCGSVLRSPGYSGALLVRLKSLYDKGQLCDFCLVADNMEVRVHSVVLFSASKYFREQMEEGTLLEPRFALQTANSDCLQTLVDFMYTGNLALSQESIWIILALASQLEIPEVVNLCQKFLEGLTPGLPELQNLGRAGNGDIAQNLSGVWSANAPGYKDPDGTLREALSEASSGGAAIKQELGDTDLTSSFGFIDDVENAEALGFDDSAEETVSRKSRRKSSPRKAKTNTRVSDLDVSFESCVLEEVTPRRRGRPKGSKNKAKNVTVEQVVVPRKRGRPRKIRTGESPDRKKVPGESSGFMNGSAFANVIKLKRSSNSKQKCDSCDQVYRWHSLLHSHQTVHISKHLPHLRSRFLVKNAQVLLSSSRSEVRGQSSENTKTVYQCRCCSKAFDLRTALKSHLLKKRSSAGYHKCNVCGPLKTFTAAKYLYLHTRHTHRETLNSSNQITHHWKCSKCSRQFLHRSSLQKHNRAAHSHKSTDTTTYTIVTRKKWQCEEDDCHFIAFSRRDLNAHIQQVHPYANYQCVLCRFVTNIRTVFRRHQNRYHSNPQERSGKVCDICGKLFPKMSRLKLHMFSKHKIRDPAMNVYPCPIEGCNYASPFKDGLNRHKVKHQPEKPFSCNFCGKHFKTEKGVEKHTNKVHLGIRNFVCDICGMAYGEDAELKIHMARHSDIKTHHCEHCDYATFDKGNYKTHLYGKHGIKLVDDMRIFQCSLCEFSTNTKYRFSDHMRVHYEVRDIPCPRCGKLFMTRKAMRSHVKKVHNPKEFRCDVCTYHTSDKTKLRDHVRIMHTHRNLKPYKCPYCSFQCATGGNCRKHVKQRHKNEEVRYLKLDPQAAVEGDAATTPEDGPVEGYHGYGGTEAGQNVPVNVSLEPDILGNSGHEIGMLRGLGMGGPMNMSAPYDNSTVAWQPFVSPMGQGSGHV